MELHGDRGSMSPKHVTFGETSHSCVLHIDFSYFSQVVCILFECFDSPQSYVPEQVL